MVSVVPYMITLNENTLILSTVFVFWNMTLFLVFLGCHLSAPCFDLRLLEWLSAHLYSTHISYRVCIPMWCFMWVVVWMLRKLLVPVSLFCGCSHLIFSVTFAILPYLLLKLSPPSLQAPTLWAACPFSLFSLHPHYRLEDTIDRKVTQGSLQMDLSSHCCHSLLWIDCLHFCCLCPATLSMRTKWLSSTLGCSPC